MLTPAVQNNTVVVANGMTAPGWFAPPTVLPFESNENYTFLAVDTEFIRFAFTQASPFPNVTLNGQMQPTITDYNGTSNPTNIVLSGVLAGAVPTVGNVTSFLDVRP